MKVLLCLVAVGLSAHVFAQSDDDHTAQLVSDEESSQNDDKFLRDVDQVLQKCADEAEEKSDNDDNAGRRRRSIVTQSLAGLGLLSSLSSYHVRGSDVYNRLPYRQSSYGYYYKTPAFNAVPAYYTSGSLRDGRWSFVRFFKSFTPLQAFRTIDNTYVRNYVRIGSIDDCLSDFRRLHLTEVKPITSPSAVVHDYRLAAASSSFAGVARETTVGYVGLMRGFLYKVLAIRSGCQLEGFPDFHDCIVFRGATYPFARTERRFIYVNQQSVALASVNYGRSPSYSAVRGLRASWRDVLSGQRRDWF